MADVQVVLAEDGLGTLELGCYPYVVTSVQIGSPAVRSVLRSRALADGVVDNSKYLGARAVTVALRLHNSYPTGSDCTSTSAPQQMQELIDRVLPYMSPRLRPRLVYSMPGLSTEKRSMIVRGESWPVAWQAAKFPTLPLSFVCPSGEIVADDGEGGGDVCLTIVPSSDVEAGRTYDLTFDRAYPAGSPLGGRTFTNPGNSWANWTLTIYGQVLNPNFTVNGATIDFNNNGGLNLLGGTSVVLDSRERTILLNGDPTTSRYNRTNYSEWAWDDVRLRPGTNTVLFSGDTLGGTATAVLCYRPTYLG